MGSCAILIAHIHETRDLATMYSRSQIASHFATTPETVRRWSKDFARFLSPSATDKNKSSYTDDDMLILAYVHNAYTDNQTTDNIIASVASGARGEWDGYLKNHSVAITEADAVAINQLRVERDSLQIKLLEAEKRIAILESQVGNEASLQGKVDALNREIGRLEARLAIMHDSRKTDN